MSEELKPCPFCGGEAKTLIDCGVTGCEVCDSYSCGTGDWNTRHLTRAEVEKWCADNGLTVVDHSIHEAVIRAKRNNGWDEVAPTLIRDIGVVFDLIAAAKEGE